MRTGTLYLIPALLGEQNAEDVLPEGTLKIIRRLDHFIAEELRTARRFLRKAGSTVDFDQISMLVFNEHSKSPTFEDYLLPAIEGHDIGLLSEAGTPCIADPGSEIVKLAHENGIPVKPLTGPSSILLSMMASGFNGQNFAFNGYLPVDKNQRLRQIRDYERQAWEKRQTQVFIETPYRNDQLLQAFLQSCREDTMLAVCSNLSSAGEKISVFSVRDWKKTRISPGKAPSVFLIYRA